MTAKPWKDFFDSIPGWLRMAIVVCLTGTASSVGTMKFKSDDTDNEVIRRVIREELRPLDAGFRALVDTLPDNQKAKVFQAMSAPRRERGN